MRTYIQIAKNTWDEALTYRLSFVLYRLQSVFSLLTVYFLWSAVLPPGKELFGYEQQSILTYIFMTNIVDAFVFSSRTTTIASDINEGTLSNFLIRPLSYLKYYFARDISDKAMNLIFAVIEVAILFLLLRPPFYIQTNLVYLVLFVVSVALAIILFFYISVLLGFIGFWSNEAWGPRFIFYQLVGFFSGGLFPLDILPQTISLIFQALPFSYLLYFPIKIYLGQLSILHILFGIAISLFWIGVMYKIVQFVWHKGLRSYTAQGR